MRKNRLIALIGTLTMAAAGLAAVSAGVSSKKAEGVSADNSGACTNIYLAYSSEYSWISNVSVSINGAADEAMTYDNTEGRWYLSVSSKPNTVRFRHDGVQSADCNTPTINLSNDCNGYYINSRHTNLEGTQALFGNAYTIGSFCNWSIWDSNTIKLSYKNNQWEGSGHLNADSEFKVLMENKTGTPSYYGYEKLKNESGQAVNAGQLTGSGTSNITAVYSGTYNFYYTNSTLYIPTISGKVTFNNNGGSGTMADQTITVGSSANLTACSFTKNGYAFSGWSTTNSGSVEYNDQSSFEMNSGDGQTLYAIWSAKPYNVYTGTLTNCTCAVASTGAFDSNLAITLTKGSQTGYDFSDSISYTIKNGNTVLTSGTATSGTAFNYKMTGTYYSSVTIDATCTKTPQTYSINYNPGANGTGSIPSGSKTYGADATLSSSTFTSTRDRFTQTGWSRTDGGAKAFELGGTYTEEASITLFPFWTETAKPTYTVTIAVNDSSRGTVSSSSVVVEEGTTYSTSENTLSFATTPVTNVTASAKDPTGAYTYAFTGWSSNSGTINAATTITANFSAKDNKYSISWSAPSDVSVTYNSPAGDNYLYHAQILEPTINSMTGYDFDGWYYTDSAHSSETKITSWPFQLESDTSIVGKFTKQTFSVAVEIYKGQADWGTISGDSFSNVPYGSAVTVDGNKLTINGQTITATANDGGDVCTYKFAGWVDYPATITDGSQHIKARFSKTMKTYTLDWNFNGGSTEQTAGVDYTAADTYDYGTPITAPTLTKEGFTFSSWSPEFSSTLTGNVTYTAQWVRENGYYIHVYGDNDRVIKMSENNGEYSASASITKDEKFKITKFAGGSETEWYGYENLKTDLSEPRIDAKSTQQIGDAASDNHNLIADISGTNIYTVYFKPYNAGFEDPGLYIPSVVNVQFDLNGKTGTAPANQVVNSRGLVTKPEDPTTTESYEFEGWYSEAACTNKWDFDTFQVVYFSVDSTTHVATQKIYAKWESTQTDFTVTLDPNGGTAGSQTSVTATYNQPMPALTEEGELPTKLNNTFNGYFTETTGGTKYYNADGTSANNWDIKENKTLYAQWIMNNGTYITGDFAGGFNLNGQYVMTLNADNPSGHEYVIKDVTLGNNSKLKVYYANEGVVTWEDDGKEGKPSANTAQEAYPVSIDNSNNLVVEKEGKYDVYFDTQNRVYHVKEADHHEDGFYFVVNGTDYYKAKSTSGYTGTEYTAQIQFEEGDTVRAYHQGEGDVGTVYDITMHESVKVWEYQEGVGLTCPDDGVYSLYLINNTSTEHPGYNLVSIFKENEEEAVNYAREFLKAMDLVCKLSDDGEGHIKVDTVLADLQAAWLAQKEAFNQLKPTAKTYLTGAKAVYDEESTDVLGKFAARYDYIYGKYHASLGKVDETHDYGGDFALRNPTLLSDSRLFSVNNVSTSTWIIASVAIVGIAAVGVFFIYRKRKEN